MQYRESGSGDRIVFRKASIGSHCRALDVSRRYGLVSLLRDADFRKAAQRRVQLHGAFWDLLVDVRTSRRLRGEHVGVEANKNGFPGLALCVWLVLRGAAVVAAHHTRRVECECGAQHSTRMGTNLWELLEVLDRSDRSSWRLFVSTRLHSAETVAGDYDLT